VVGASVVVVGATVVAGVDPAVAPPEADEGVVTFDALPGSAEARATPTVAVAAATTTDAPVVMRRSRRDPRSRRAVRPSPELESWPWSRTCKTLTSFPGTPRGAR
jgi:hypothetical protein